MNKGLRDIAENIMFNGEIRKLIQNPNQDGLYKTFSETCIIKK